MILNIILPRGRVIIKRIVDKKTYELFICYL